MSDKFKNILNILFNALLAVYPVLVFYFLIFKKVPVRMFSLFTIALGFSGLIIWIFIKSGTSSEVSFGKSRGKKLGSGFWNPLLLIFIGGIGFITNTDMIPKFFPVIMNIMLLFTFGITLFDPPPMIYRFAILMDKSIQNSPGQEQTAAYCYKVTVVWVVFFIINGSIAAFTVFYGSDLIWAIYNNAVAPVLIGLIFIIEFIVRKIVQRNIPKTHT